MKKVTIICILATVMASFLGMAVQAQNTVVSGTNLNIGSNNTIMDGNTDKGNAIGSYNVVQSLNALAVGEHDTIMPYSLKSIALGSYNYIEGLSSMALGREVKVQNHFGFGIGQFLRITASSGCMAIGTGIIKPGNNNYEYLENSTSNSLAVGFNSTVPTLFVSESPNGNGQQTIDRTGRVAIGNVTPTAKLHIRSDDDEDAKLILEPGDGKTHCTKLTLHDAAHYLMVNPDDKMEMVSSGALGIDAEDLQFQDGRLDLGTAGQRKLTLTPSEAPAIYCNAYRDGGIYRRHRPGSSYALEFWTDSLVMRASRNQGERGTQITNWRNAVSITTDGQVTLNGKVGVNTANTSQSHALAVDGGLVATNGPVTLNGPVGINTANTTQEYALAVDGGVIATKVRIQLKNDWPDRVFAPDYALRPMEELREYVAVNRHLPGVPSEEEVSERGIDVGSMQAVLLEKIEELTLYILRQQQEMDTLKRELEELRGTVRFGYDACGNRVTRTLEVKREDDKNHLEGGHPKESDANATPTVSGDLVGGMAYAIYPNPTEGRLVLVTEGTVPPEGAVATLLTLTGSLMEERVVRSNREELDLSGRPSGVYLLRLSYGNETHTWKVIKGE